jgi:chromosome segregation ATPase
MSTSHKSDPYRVTESAPHIFEWLWPPLGVLRAMQCWSSAGTAAELPQEVARLGSVEQHEGVIQASVEPIETEVTRLRERLDSADERRSAFETSLRPLGTELERLTNGNAALEHTVSDMGSALGSQRKELTAVAEAKAELERRLDEQSSTVREELSALKTSNAELERKVAALPAAVSDMGAALRSLREELTGLKKSNADLERGLAERSSAPAQDHSGVSKPSSRAGSQGSRKTDGTKSPARKPPRRATKKSASAGKDQATQES